MLRQRHRGALESFRLQRARAKAWSPVTALPKPPVLLGLLGGGGWQNEEQALLSLQEVGDFLPRELAAGCGRPSLLSPNQDHEIR